MKLHIALDRHRLGLLVAASILLQFATPARAGNEILVADNANGIVSSVPFPYVLPQGLFATPSANPVSIRLGPNRCVYVVNGTVQRFWPNGAPDVAFNTAFASFGIPSCADVAFDEEENMYISMALAGVVLKCTATNTCGTWNLTFCSLFPQFTGGLGRPGYILFHPTSGNLLIADFQNHQILQHQKNCDLIAPSPFVPPSTNGLTNPENMAWGPDGNLYVTSDGTGQVLRFDSLGGAIPGVFAPALAEISTPHGLAFGPDGKLYVGNRSSPTKIVRYGLTGSGSGTYDAGFSITGMDPYAFLFRQTGVGTFEDALVCYQSDNSIRRYDMTSGEEVGDGLFALSAPGDLSYMHSMRMGHDGRVYVISHSGPGIQGVKRLTWDGTFLDTFIPIGTGGLVLPEDLAFGPGPNAIYPTQDCNVYVTDYASGRIRKYDNKTGASGGTFGPALTGPNHLVFHPFNHDLYVADRAASKIVRLNGVSGAQAAFVTLPPGSNMECIDIGPDGNVYLVADSSRILHFTPALVPLGTGVFAIVGSVLSPNLHGIAFGPDDNLYVTNRGSTGTEVFALQGPFGNSPGDPMVSNAGIFHDTGTCGPSLPFMVLFRPTIPVDNVPFAEPGTEFCGGDGVDTVVTTPCPCANYGDREHGCQNSHLTGGALLTAGGLVPWAVPSTMDTIVLECAGMRMNSLCVYFQGSVTIPSGVVNGDGIRCIGSLKRLTSKIACCGRAIFPDPALGDPSVSTRSAALGDPLSPGMTRYYQVAYRDPDPGYCAAPSGSTINISSAYAIPW